MKTLILIADVSITFSIMQETLGKKFRCSIVMENRLAIENGSEHIFIDFDDDIKNDYEEASIRNSDFHFYSVLYHSEKFVKEILLCLKDFSFSVDDDEGKIIPIQDFIKDFAERKI